MTDPKPWTDRIPLTDVDSFVGGRDSDERPMSAGVRPALLIVDMTLAFVDSRYPTGYGDTGWPAVETTARLLAAARERRVPIYFTKAFEDVNHVVLPQEHGQWKSQGAPPAPTDLPPGDVIVEQLTPGPAEVVIHKGMKPSAFFGTPLASYLQQDGVDTVIIAGMTTSGCVRASALDAFQHNFAVIVPHECSADRSQVSHAVSLFDLHMKYADVISLRETLAYLTVE